MAVYDVKNHAPSVLPEGEWKLVWNDEFDGNELDRSKWDYRLCMMGKRWNAWTDKGVHLDGKSNLVFTLTEDENGKPVSSQLQTGYNFMDEPTVSTKFGADFLQWNIGKLHENKFVHGCGYYECRCRLQQKPGWWSAFWIQSSVIGASLDPADSGVEIDIMESFKPGDIAGHNVFTGGYGLDMKNCNIGGMTGLDTEEFHTFGLLWDETGYTFYVDGKEDGKITDFITKRPEFILISTEVKGYRSNENHEPLQEAYDSIGDTFLVDHIRVFDKI